MHADNLDEFDMEEYPELTDTLVRGRVYLICEMQFAWDDVADDGDPIEATHDCTCVLIKEFDRVSPTYQLTQRPDNGLSRESAAALAGGGCIKLLERGNLKRSKWHMLPVKHVLGRLYLAPVTHQPGLRTAVERRRELWLARARAAAEHASDARGPASDESAGDRDPEAGSDSDPDAPAARGPPGRCRHGPSRGAAAAAHASGAGATGSGRTGAAQSGFGASPSQGAPMGHGWSGRRWEFGTDNDCDRQWWTMPWVDKWGRDLTYRK